MTDHGDPPGPEDGPSGTAGPGGTGGSSREAWDDVAARLSNLGKQVRSRFDQPSQRPSGSQDPSESGGDSVRRWLDTLDDTFTKLGDTVRDPQFRKEAGSSVSRLGEALGVTLRDLGEQLQQKFGGRHEASRVGTGEPMPDVPPPSAPGGSGAAEPPQAPGSGEATGGSPPPSGPTGGPPSTGPTGGPPPGTGGPGGDPPADDERPPTL